ncbi:hypothetical protein STEG23_002460, partial [Scotinomys teguina]
SSVDQNADRNVCKVDFTSSHTVTRTLLDNKFEDICVSFWHIIWLCPSCVLKRVMEINSK